MKCLLKERSEYLQLLPLIAFVVYARIFSMADAGLSDAFIFAGFCSVFVCLFFWHYNMVFDRLLLGMNLFFLVGAYGSMFSCAKILQWYAAPMGSSFFGCVAIVGLLATLFTKFGFIGMQHKKSQATQYASFLLFGATVIALIWSIKFDESGWFVALVIPFILLFVVRRVLITQMD